MWQDPLVEEIRIIRDEYAGKFDYDLDAIYRDLKEKEIKNGRKLFTFPAKRLEPEKGKRSEQKGTGLDR